MKSLLGRWYVRLVLAALVLAAWSFGAQLSWRELVSALAGLGTASFVLAAAFIALNLVVGALRWQLLVRAFGATAPAFAPTLHAYFVAFFFNTFLPANIAGDLLRAAALRQNFATPSAPFVLIVIERLLGIAGLFLLAGGVALVRAALPTRYALAVLGVGVALALVALATASSARRLSRLLPARLAGLLAGVPRLCDGVRFAGALALSVLTQASFSAGACVLVLEASGVLDVWRALAVVPLALLSIYLPTFAGFGTREAAFAFALAPAGVSEVQATAASLAFGAAHLCVALVGGVLHALRRVQ